MMETFQKRDYYEVLGIERDASPQEIRKAFRRLARQYHPDVNKDPNAAELFQEINEAHEILSDSQKRAMYDRFGHAVPGNGAVGIDPVDIFGHDSPFSSVFDTFFGGFSSRGSRGPQRGSDLSYPLHLTFEEAVFGCEKSIEYRRFETCSHCGGNGAEPGTTPSKCPKCNGMGEIRQRSPIGNMVMVTTCNQCDGTGETVAHPCQVCGGDGALKQNHQIVVKIPAGVDSGSQIRISNGGNAGPRGGPYGHLSIPLEVQPHALFVRDGNDIILEWKLNVAQAALGTAITVPTFEGDETITIPAGSQTGDVVRLPGKGVPFVRQSGRGDQVIVLSVHIPTRLNSQQRTIFEQLRESLGQEPIEPMQQLDEVADTAEAAEAQVWT